ncbi:MAG: hypothetical protein ACR2H6_12740 [Pyrinomonadaceae bacterium]
MNNKIKPALLGGGALGLLLVITVVISSFVPFIGCCNCLWPIAAGVLATMFYVKGSATPATIADGAMVGAIAGVVGGLIYLVIGLPLSFLINGVTAMDAQVRQMSPDFPIAGAALLIVGGLIGFVIFVVLATLGGVLGIPIFEKRKGTIDAPPPPQDFGSGPGGSYGAGL